MTQPFHTQIRSALANPGLQAALDVNAERRLAARRRAYTSLPEDLQVLRQRAHAVRAETLAHLDLHLERFTAAVQANGGIVHRAADADEAAQIVLEIARSCEARLVAKSKTMIGEEIELNAALQTAGLEVVETDLGEFIVQLRGERPAHITTPAVHLSRGDVARTFTEKLGIPYTEDIAALVAAARRALRQVFLSADLGITGVNFGVVEDGALCLVTNEGNGRLVATLPRVHVALMGIERLVPTLDDLALMLSLLPRSATGQKLTVYTSLNRSPRRPGETEGPQERHVVLVDNGREALRRSPLAEALYCIRCGACLNACPVFREIGGHAYVGAHGQASAYPGPIGSVLAPGLFGASEFGGLARASSLCGACREACPVDIDLPKLLLRVRAGMATGERGKGIGDLGQGSRDRSATKQAEYVSPVPAPLSSIPPSLRWGLRFYAWLAASPRRFRLALRLAGFLGRLMSPRSPWLRLPAFTGWGVSRDFPRPAARPFRDRIAGAGGGASGVTLPASSGDVDPFPLGAGVEAQNAPEPTGQPAAGAPAAGAPLDGALVERFAAELTAVGGTFHLTARPELPGRLLALLRERGIDAIQAWEPAHLPAGLLETLRDGGVRITYSADPALRAGLTGAAGAIAETGSLALPGGPGRPQSASLLPEIHLAILQPADIRANLLQALRLREAVEAGSFTLITGPSRTADIEMTLTVGVHGPGELHVFCLSAAPADEDGRDDDHHQD